MKIQERAIEWNTPVAQSFSLDFCRMELDAELVLRFFFQERTESGQVSFYSLTWPNWIAYKTTLEPYIPGVEIIGFKDQDSRYLTFKIEPSTWLEAHRQAFLFPVEASHFVIETESLGLEIISIHQGVFENITEPDAQALGLRKQTAIPILTHPLDREEIELKLESARLHGQESS